MSVATNDAGSTLRVDAVVIGAGIAGASAAWALARDMDVVIVEQEAHAGHHATGRSASVLSETSGHPVVCALARASRRFFESPPASMCDHPVLSDRGLLWIGREGEVAALDELARAGQKVAPSVRRLDVTRTLELLPGFHEHAVSGGGVHEPDAMAIDTAAVLQGFVRGLGLLTSAEAVDIRRTSSGWLVVAGSHSIECAVVVNAAGAWGDVVAQRAGIAPLGLQPMRRTACIVPAPESVRAWPLVMDVAGRFYTEPEAGGLLLSPADETPVDPCDARPEELDVALALEQLADATTIPVRSVRQAWAGLRTFSPDRAPVVGEEQGAPGFWWLVGQGGAGIKTAPAMAETLAALLAGRPLDPLLGQLGVTAAALSPTRFR